MPSQLSADLQKLKNPAKAKILQRFFKTGPGQYGEGDKFLGIVVPEQRKIAKKHAAAKLPELQRLLKSKTHEYRLTALLILAEQYRQAEKAGDLKQQKILVDFYLKNTSCINNWDLVDLSAPNILGRWLLEKDRRLLYQLAKSANLWERRIAIIATFNFIRAGQLQDTIKLSQLLLNDRHDLIHKAVGWMLREIGKRQPAELKKFLAKNRQAMPRVMLRYAIEKFPPAERKKYLRP